MSMMNEYVGRTVIVECSLTEEEIAEIVDAERALTQRPKQLSLKEALEVSRKNSSVRDQGNSYHLYGVFPDGDRLSERLHPTRNDIDRHGRPNRKKKGSLKPKKWLK